VNCKNCNNTLKENQRFCDYCGSPILKNRLTPKILLRQINEEFLSIDNKFLQTFLVLITKPEEVIDGYINGLRKRYIGVLTYYAVALTILGFQMFLFRNFFPDFLDGENNAFMSGFDFGSQGEFGTASLEFLESFNDNQGILFSILMPLLAVGTWIVYLDKKRHNYTEHLVLNLYMTAQTIYFSFIIYLLLAIFKVVDLITASLIITPPLMLYGAYVLNRIYKSTFIKSLLRYLAAYIIYMIIFSVTMAIIIAIIFVYLFVTGKLNV